jgi:hypothetical protein
MILSLIIHPLELNIDQLPQTEQNLAEQLFLVACKNLTLSTQASRWVANRQILFSHYTHKQDTALRLECPSFELPYSKTGKSDCRRNF